MWDIETPDPGEPTRLLAEGDTIEVGDVCLQVIETLPPDTVCLTGHGGSTTMARELMQNPFMQM